MAPVTGGGFVRVHVVPPSLEICGARVIRVTGIQIAAAHDSVVRIAEIDGECACAGRANQWSVIGVPGVALIPGGKDPRDVSAASRNPRVPPALRCDARSARREGEFTRQGRRHVAADVLPCHPVGCAKIGEHSID